jgi:hypothetical protein
MAWRHAGSLLHRFWLVGLAPVLAELVCYGLSLINLKTRGMHGWPDTMQNNTIRVQGHEGNDNSVIHIPISDYCRHCSHFPDATGLKYYERASAWTSPAGSWVAVPCSTTHFAEPPGGWSGDVTYHVVANVRPTATASTSVSTAGASGSNIPNPNMAIGKNRCTQWPMSWHVDPGHIGPGTHRPRARDTRVGPVEWRAL